MNHSGARRREPAAGSKAIGSLRWSLMALATLALLATGCASSKSRNRGASPQGADADGQSRLGYSTIQPLSGKVKSVHPGLRFVILDFSVARMPAVDQRLGIYRGGERIGTVKVTGPYLETTVAADIVIGEAGLGDEVRGD